ISRGQLVEIGGSFRIPEVISKAGAIMVEVGTTNRTHLSDYEQAIGAETAALLYVHPSNYRVEGFTGEVSLEELAVLARRKKLPLLMDLGSGSLLNQPVDGITDEPSVAAVLKAGTHIATFSGDKLLGGPQSGIAVGKNRWLKRMHANPLYRALRCDKLTLALLEQTLRTYIDRKSYREANLSLTLLNRDREQLHKQALKILEGLKAEVLKKGEIKVIDSEVEAGSGSLPGKQLDSVALAFYVKGTSPSTLAKRFRQAQTPVLGYIRRNAFHIDLKAVPERDTAQLASAINEVLSSTR
ncbi:MAG: L-seryl-tRNA(Sec) selenium transferase, partial [Candidatus Marinimicrobia bacterium]|nr:L-seryl-tRNA(Sec) selenium transferase [Candidatus Neomarinimicrobiota bacterium]